MPSSAWSTPQDVIAAVHDLLGYHPDSTLVAIALTARRAVVALRYDLPGQDAHSAGEAAGAVAGHLIAALARCQADEVALVGYGTADQARPAVKAALAWLSEVLTVREALVVTGTRFWSLTCGQCCPPDGVEIDGPPAAQLPDPDVAPCPDRPVAPVTIAPQGGPARRAMRAAVARAIRQLTPIGPDGPEHGHLMRLRALMARPVPLSDADAAELIVLLGDSRLRDEAWAITNTSSDPSAQVAFWADLTRRAPARHAAPPASILAYAAACLAGNSPLARAAVARALAADRRYPMALLIRYILDAGVPAAQCRIRLTAACLPPVPRHPAG